MTRIFFITLAATVLQLSVCAEFEQTRELSAQTRWAVDTINSRHYLRESIQSLDGNEIIESFVETFDYNHMYLSREEVDDFIFRFGGSMEEFLQKGNLYPAFEMYEVFKENAQKWNTWVNERLDQDFDFSADDSFSPDRSKSEWPADDEKSIDVWERRLKYELLNELLSLASEETESDLDLGEKTNPDVIKDTKEEDYNPEKIQRLLNDKAFLAETLDAAREKIRRRYRRNLSYIVNREAVDVQESFINSMTQLFDPHSSFLSANTLENFNTSVQNSFFGIGALLQDVDGICTIKQILPGGPAEESGLLKDEDQILAVGQGKDGELEDVVDMQLRYIVQKIKGKKGTTVRLLIHPGSSSDPSVRKEVLITRGEVKLTANLASAKLIQVPDGEDGYIPVGVIELPSFYGNIGAGGSLKSTSDDVAELLKKLRAAGVEGIVLDLRMNGGGLLSEAVKVAGLFIEKGPVVQVRSANGRIGLLTDRDSDIAWSGPLIVLTSRFSASASEIVAGALQDHNRALIVGNTSTHGKGTVQEVYQMNDLLNISWLKPNSAASARPVASKITIKQFYLPGGSSTQLRGVLSDIALPSVNEFLPIGESDLPHALPWNRIEAVDLEKPASSIASPESEPNLEAMLTEKSNLRQQSLEEFKFLNEQIQWRRQRYDEKSISLNLEKRIARKIKDQAYIEELDEIYEALTEDVYAKEDFILKVAEEQDVLSKKNLEANESTLADEKTDDEDRPDFDIYLRESARIMADWIIFLKEDPQATVIVDAKSL